MQIQKIPLWSVDVHKIHIKEWALVKDRLLSIIPWDINQRKNKFARETFEHEMTWTDYFLQGADNSDGYMDHLGNLQTPVKYISTSVQYERVFLSMISPYLREFLKLLIISFVR